MGRKCWVMHNRNRLESVIILFSHLQIDRVVTHEKKIIQGIPLVMRGICDAPLQRGKSFCNHMLRLRGQG
jgi:hypothetical protein